MVYSLYDSLDQYSYPDVHTGVKTASGFTHVDRFPLENQTLCSFGKTPPLRLEEFGLCDGSHLMVSSHFILTCDFSAFLPLHFFTLPVIKLAQPTPYTHPKHPMSLPSF